MEQKRSCVARLKWPLSYRPMSSRTTGAKMKGFVIFVRSFCCCRCWCCLLFGVCVLFIFTMDVCCCCRYTYSLAIGHLLSRISLAVSIVNNLRTFITSIYLFNGFRDMTHYRSVSWNGMIVFFLSFHSFHSFFGCIFYVCFLLTFLCVTLIICDLSDWMMDLFCVCLFVC